MTGLASREGADDTAQAIAGEAGCPRCRGSAAWDMRYWCTAHELAHTARELIEDHLAAAPSTPEPGIDVELLTRAMSELRRKHTPNWSAYDYLHERSNTDSRGMTPATALAAEYARLASKDR